MNKFEERTRPPHYATRCMTQSGEVAGFLGAQGERIWLGVPYAAPPVGLLRWRAPQPPLSWSGPRFTVEHAQPSVQRSRDSDGGPIYIGSEDCLYLNIWAPPDRQKSAEAPGLRPVMFWIHGGGNCYDTGNNYDGAQLAITQSVVVVTVNFRLGLCGWFRHPALHGPHTNAIERSGNFGLLDLIQALHWVRTNIDKFGGDPINITVFGESAGGANVLALLVSPCANGLLQKAIVQSALPTSMPASAAENYSDDHQPGDPLSAAELIVQLLLNDDLALNREAAKSKIASWDNSQIAKYLRAKSPMELDSALQQLRKLHHRRDTALLFPQLFEDGAVIPAEGVKSALLHRREAEIPLMLGCTRDEYSNLLALAKPAIFAQRNAYSGQLQIPDKTRYLLAAEYLGKLMKAACVDEPAAQLAQNTAAGVYAYRFDWNSLAPAPWLDDITLGAPHGLDVLFIFDRQRLRPIYPIAALLNDVGNPSNFQKLSYAVMSYWAEFAAHGDPGCGRHGDLPRWFRWSDPAMPSATCMVLAESERDDLHMSSEQLTKAGVLSHLLRDHRFEHAEAVCRMLFDLLDCGGFSLLNESDYVEAFDGMCQLRWPRQRGSR